MNWKKQMDNLFAIAFLITVVCAWFTHIFFCFASASWGFLIAGALFFPVGIVHGIYLWLN